MGLTVTKESAPGRYKVGDIETINGDKFVVTKIVYHFGSSYEHVTFELLIEYVADSMVSEIRGERKTIRDIIEDMVAPSAVDPIKDMNELIEQI